MARAPQLNKLTKAEGYRIGLYTSLYDLRGLVEAFGTEFVVWLVNAIDKNPDVTNLNQAREEYVDHLSSLEDMELVAKLADMEDENEAT